MNDAQQLQMQPLAAARMYTTSRRAAVTNSNLVIWGVLGFTNPRGDQSRDNLEETEL